MLHVNDLPGVDAVADFVPDENYTSNHLHIQVTFLPQSGYVNFETFSDAQHNSSRLYIEQQVNNLVTSGDKLEASLSGLSTKHNNNSLYGSLIYVFPGFRHGDYFELLGRHSQYLNTQIQGITQKQDVSTLRGAYTINLERNMSGYKYLIPEYDYITIFTKNGQNKSTRHSQNIKFTYLSGHHLKSNSFLEYAITLTGGYNQNPKIHEKRNYTHLRAGTSFSKPFHIDNAPFTFELNLLGQLAFTSLPDQEKIAQGYHPILRGYSQGETVGDSGVGSTLELHYHSYEKAFWDSTDFYIFLDSGKTWSKRFNLTHTNRALLSSGVGFDLLFMNNYVLSNWIGIPLRKGRVNNVGDISWTIKIAMRW